MTAPGDALLFAYIKDVLIEVRRPLTAGEIASRLSWSVSTTARVTAQAVQADLLTVDRGRYSLAGGVQ